MSKSSFQHIAQRFAYLLITLYSTALAAQQPDSTFYDYTIRIDHYQIHNIFDSQSSLLNGAFTEYYENGQMKADGELVNGWRKGTWRAWKEDGTLAHQRTYAHPWSYVIDYPKAPPKGPAALFNSAVPLERQHGLYTYDSVVESEVYWEKRLWFDLDPSENPLLFKDDFLLNTLEEAIIDESATGVYSGENDRFFNKLDQVESLNKIRTQKANIIGIRVKSVWFFSSKTQRMDRRILGLAPLCQVEGGESEPLMWFYYPEIRQMLQKVPLELSNTELPIKQLEDLFHYWHFSGQIIKESNVYDRSISDYLSHEEDLKREHLRILLSTYNFEHETWINSNQGESILNSY